jgi:hypothetical protein
MRYKLNPNRPYKVGRATQNQHHEIWDGYQPIFANSGKEGAPDWQLHSVDKKYGKGGNRGNTNYFKYCVKSQWIVPVQVDRQLRRSKTTLDWRNLNEQHRRIEQRKDEIHVELPVAERIRSQVAEEAKDDLVRLEFSVSPIHVKKIKAYVEMLQGS